MMDTKNMTIHQAKNMLAKGFKVRHQQFSTTEFIYIKDDKFQDADGNILPWEDFWAYRTHYNFNTGWSVVISLGEKIVRTSFNVAEGQSKTQIDEFKIKCAELINYIEQFKEKDPRLVSITKTKLEEAAMFGVKAITA